MIDLPERLAKKIRATATTAGRGRGIAPELSFGRHAGPAPSSARRAAVVLLLFRREGRWHVPLTVRPLGLSRHGGQMSLPGGTIDAGEASDAAALRELREELGIETGVELLGPLADSYVYVSNFIVTPWLAHTRAEPEWRPNAAEVDHVVELPLRVLLDASRVTRRMIERGPLRFSTPGIEHGSHFIWGATNVILGQLRDVLVSIVASADTQDTLVSTRDRPRT